MREDQKYIPLGLRTRAMYTLSVGNSATSELASIHFFVVSAGDVIASVWGVVSKHFISL